MTATTSGPSQQDIDRYIQANLSGMSLPSLVNYKIGDRVQINPAGRYPEQGSGGLGTVVGYGSTSHPLAVMWDIPDPSTRLSNNNYAGLDLLPASPPSSTPTKQGELPVSEPSEPYKQLLKKDVTEGMGFTVISDIHFSPLVPADTVARVVFSDHRGVGMDLEGWTGGNDLGGLLPDGTTSGYIVTIAIINSYMRPLIAAKVNFDSVILADDKKSQIIHALKQIDNHKLIFTTWGFDKTFEKGKGISMLFYGPPGTGKTLMAQAIAHKLDYKLKVVSNADIQSSVPGEAERNIRKYFKESKSKTVLLFDECDSLIHTRSSVGAILGAQINELLSQLERFEGVTVFTTNRLGILDEAVNRRLSIKVEFAMPSAAERVKIWQRMFPDEAPLDRDIKWKALAKYEIAGGHIKNAVLRAAREAATEDLPDNEKTITMKHLKKGLEQEVESTNQFNKAKHQYEGRYRWGGGHGDGISEGVGEGLKIDDKLELKRVRKSVAEMSNVPKA